MTDPAKLARIREAEGDITKARIQLMLNAGANVVLTTKGIDDMAMKFVFPRLLFPFLSFFYCHLARHGFYSGAQIVC